MRLLIVEDEPDLLAGLAKALREEDYAVDTAEDGEDGLFKATEARYDALILDVMLPGIDGWKVLEKIRAHKNEEIRKTPVLMLTARDRTADRVRGLDTGADDYLVKPFDLPELLARIRALIRRSAGIANPAIQIGDLSIDLRAREVRRGKENIPLTAREYSLLEFLVTRQGEVVTRTTLYDHLFDENESSFSNLLDVHVSNLRKKLGADFITTRRGHGYCIEKA
ncbi:MAG TPA: response regulator transcription factor [Verrucomicrobiae bacterium]